ncbi:multidrug efflux pump subunit AcrA (membrane-fusion protein) [Thermonema lapsum]|uniref:Multidrug efflux pump subunit AcrA (Membrane-fusion protein) n=1 Tax=Thermonema lapsum TaxID=28195 RepID=A0A846MPZ6_9BACT|nr:efflux RND transporter periplasmic adaptor subunit [Thermonema lapsum]NIK73501.1 multidrug efflux pump subunit AcrA (membrane-fusion protein) [Thermonema lapsum]
MLTIPSRRKLLITILPLLMLPLAWWLLAPSADEAEGWVLVQKGDLSVQVLATGELTARQAVEVTAPALLRSLEIYQIKIVDLIPEGSQVKAGDYLATLDNQELSEKMQQLRIEIEKLENERNQALIDTALALRQAREELQNLALDLEMKKIQLRGTEYEPPAEQSKTRLAYERALNAYENAQQAYRLKQKQARSKLMGIHTLLNEAKRKYKMAEEALKALTLHAPTNGTVIYHKGWNGSKKEAGSMVSTWDPVVVKLSAQQELVSTARINELDIHKIKKGQAAKVRVEAFPDRIFQGEVIDISNAAESDDSKARYFAVDIRLKKQDPALRPTMSTFNRIECSLHQKVLLIPLSAVHYTPAGIPYVIKKKGRHMVRQQVQLGAADDLHVIVKKGLKIGDQVSLSIPEQIESLPWQTL